MYIVYIICESTDTRYHKYIARLAEGRLRRRGWCRPSAPPAAGPVSICCIYYHHHYYHYYHYHYHHYYYHCYYHYHYYYYYYYHYYYHYHYYYYYYHYHCPGSLIAGAHGRMYNRYPTGRTNKASKMSKQLLSINK